MLSELTPRAAQLDSLPAGARLDVHDMLSLMNCGRSSLERRLRDGRAPAPVAEEAKLLWRAGDVRAYLNGESSGGTAAPERYRREMAEGDRVESITGAQS